MSMKNLPPWAQKIEVDNQVLPFTEAVLTIDMTSNQEVIISLKGEAFHADTCEEILDPNVLHTVTLTLSNAADSPIKRPFRNEDTIDEITKFCMVEAKVSAISNSDDKLTTFEYRSTAIVAAE